MCRTCFSQAPMGGSRLVSRRLRDSIAPFFGTLTRQNFRFDETHVKVFSMDAAYAMQRGTYSQTDTSASLDLRCRLRTHTFGRVRAPVGRSPQPTCLPEIH